MPDVRQQNNVRQDYALSPLNNSSQCLHPVITHKLQTLTADHIYDSITEVIVDQCGVIKLLKNQDQVLKTPPSPRPSPTPSKQKTNQANKISRLHNKEYYIYRQTSSLELSTFLSPHSNTKQHKNSLSVHTASESNWNHLSDNKVKLKAPTFEDFK